MYLLAAMPIWVPPVFIYAILARIYYGITEIMDNKSDRIKNN